MYKRQGKMQGGCRWELIPHDEDGLTIREIATGNTYEAVSYTHLCSVVGEFYLLIKSQYNLAVGRCVGCAFGWYGADEYRGLAVVNELGLSLIHI